MRIDADGWLRIYTERADAPQKLVVLPHGGGSASYYRSFAKAFPSSVEVAVVQYPGREDRLGEDALITMDSLVDELAPRIARYADRTTSLFGHSMGASVGYEISRRLERLWGLRLRLLVVSGRPGLAHQEQGLKHRDDELLWSELGRLGGTDSQLLESSVLREGLLPVLRADYTLVETYSPTVGPELAVAIAACGGEDDPEVEPWKLKSWAEATTGSFFSQTFPGEHFYLTSQGAMNDVVRWVSGHLADPPAEAISTGGQPS